MNPIYDIQSLTQHSTASHIEWYILPKAVASPLEDSAMSFQIGTERPLFPSIAFRNPQVVEEYCYKELLYIYDRSNDGQRTVSRKVLQEDLNEDKNVYRLILQEDSLPSHRFPCSLEIRKTDSVVRKSFKINNRLHLLEDCVNEKEYVYYIRFNYATNVDMDKIQKDLNAFVGRL